MASKIFLPFALGSIILFGANLSALESQGGAKKSVQLSTKAFRPAPSTPSHIVERGWVLGAVGEAPALMNVRTKQVFGKGFKSNEEDPTVACEAQHPSGFWRSATQWDVRFAQKLKLPSQFYGSAEYRISEATEQDSRIYSRGRAFFKLRTWKDWISMMRENGAWSTLSKPAPSEVFCVAGPGLNTSKEMEIYLNPSLKREVIALIGYSMYEQYQKGDLPNEPSSVVVERVPASDESGVILPVESVRDVTLEGAAFRATQGIVAPK